MQEVAREEAKVRAIRGGRYEMEEVGEIGMAYRWCAVEVEVECVCGERWTVTSKETECPNCGRNEEEILVREKLLAQKRVHTEWQRHPWHFLKKFRLGLPY